MENFFRLLKIDRFLLSLPPPPPTIFFFPSTIPISNIKKERSGGTAQAAPRSDEMDSRNVGIPRMNLDTKEIREIFL